MRDFDLPVDIPKKSELMRQQRVWVVLLTLLGFMAFILFLLAIQLGVILSEGARQLPDIRVLENYHPNQSTQIFDRDNNLIANIHGDEDRVVVPLNQISPNVPRAVMAIEDNRFYQHNGVDLKGTLRALVSNFSGGEVQGGSTVTQQLVKNLFLSPERSIGRKVAEAVLALRVERHYKKNKIMEMYLNQVYFGNHAYGIEKAARRYFRVPASDLTIGQAALLAGLLKAPEGLSPYQFPKAARKRQLEVLNKMVEYGYITPQQAKLARQEAWNLKGKEEKASKYPFYVAHVIQELMNRYGEDVVRRGGLKVYTALNPIAQQAAEKALTNQVKGLPPYTHVTNGALVAIDVDSAEIIALVGGVDFEKSQYNNATQARRAAGSQFKPFVYLTGLRLGAITPDTPIVDRPLRFGSGSGAWSPKNWDNRYMGAMTIRQALVLSRNTTTVQVGMKVGIEEVIKTARLAGITSPIEPHFASLLGAGGIPPLEMATAFATFAREGVRMFPTAIRRVENVAGEALAIERPIPEQVLNPDAVAQLNSILVDAVEKGTGKAARLSHRTVAGKTGTTDKVRDIWFTGYTPDLVGTVWMGNEKYVPLKGVFSSNAAKVWHDFAEAYYQEFNTPAREFRGVSNTRTNASGVTMIDLEPEITDPDEGNVTSTQPSSEPTPPLPTMPSTSGSEKPSPSSPAASSGTSTLPTGAPNKTVAPAKPQPKATPAKESTTASSPLRSLPTPSSNGASKPATKPITANPKPLPVAPKPSAPIPEPG
ncbi:MAG: PBP1A family penicillin-binding protein [Vampirovibrionales bacterium]